VNKKPREVVENGITYIVHTVEKGTFIWKYKGKRHRENGPAVEWSNGKRRWYLHGKLVYMDEYDKTSDFEMTEEMALSIIKYKLMRD